MAFAVALRDAAKVVSFAELLLAYGLALPLGLCAGCTLVAPIIRRKMIDRTDGRYAREALHQLRTR